MASKPLAGITVLDLTNVLAGPFCCHQLAHFGAEVIKVEMPGRGDLARQLGADAELNAKLMGVSFLAQNAGKRSITLDLRSDEGRELFLQHADHGVGHEVQTHARADNRRVAAEPALPQPMTQDDHAIVSVELVVGAK